MAVARLPRNRPEIESITFAVCRPGSTSVVAMPIPMIPMAIFSTVVTVAPFFYLSLNQSRAVSAGAGTLGSTRAKTIVTRAR